MAMRLYWPKEEAMEGKWKAPPIERVKLEKLIVALWRSVATVRHCEGEVTLIESPTRASESSCEDESPGSGPVVPMINVLSPPRRIYTSYSKWKSSLKTFAEVGRCYCFAPIRCLPPGLPAFVVLNCGHVYE